MKITTGYKAEEQSFLEGKAYQEPRVTGIGTNN